MSFNLDLSLENRMFFFSYNENTRLKGSGTLRDFSRRGRRRRRRKNDVAEKKTSGWWVMEREWARVQSIFYRQQINDLSVMRN